MGVESGRSPGAPDRNVEASAAGGCSDGKALSTLFMPGRRHQPLGTFPHPGGPGASLHGSGCGPTLRRSRHCPKGLRLRARSNPLPPPASASSPEGAVPASPSSRHNGAVWVWMAELPLPCGTLSRRLSNQRISRMFDNGSLGRCERHLACHVPGTVEVVGLQPFMGMNRL
jgi:hypothetical protein